MLVAHDPGSCFEETLSALGSQDYPALTVSIIDAASEDDLSERAGAALPGAFLRKLPANRGFGASANAVLEMVEGADFFLFCHDDVVPDPDALGLMVEEAYRSNASIVSPKIVAYDNNERLLHVGMAADKTGAVVDRVEPGEMDRGQHDAVQDVFVAPGGFTLVRADLFRELGGFDENITALGEDLDLCWKARVVGARVVVAPAARVRHAELTAAGTRAVPPAAGARVRHGWSPRRASRKHSADPSLQALQRRHEMRAALKCYEPWHLVRVIPQMLLLGLGEMAIALVTGHTDRARSVVGAWTWNLARLRDVRRERSALAAKRVLSDHEVRQLQLHGSARLTVYVRRALTHGLHVAHLRELSPLRMAAPDDPGRGQYVTLRAVAWAAAALVVLFGLHQLLTGPMPVVGDFLPLPSWHALLGGFSSGFHDVGMGSTATGPPGAALLGTAGLLMGGSMGLVGTVLVLGCIPVGALGAARLVRPLDSPRARLASGVAYLLIPVAYNAIAGGSLPGLIAYAASPWILSCLARGSGRPPFGTPDRTPLADLLTATLSLGVITAIAGSLAPELLVLPAVLTAGMAAGGLLVHGPVAPEARTEPVAPEARTEPVAPEARTEPVAPEARTEPRTAATTARVLAVGVGGTITALVLLAPWSVHLLSGPLRWSLLGAPRVDAATASSWWNLLRLAAGPVGDTPLAWGIPVAAALALLIGSGWRLAWASRMWMAALACLVLAWLGGRGWMGPFAPPEPVMLAGAGAAMCLAIGLGTMSFEADLRAHRFGWRQGGALVATAGLVLGVLPAFGAAGTGRFDLPPSGYRQALSWMDKGPSAKGRVLWLGDPRVLLGTGWPLGSGLAYVLTSHGIPSEAALWPGSSPGPAAAIASDVRLAREGQTVRLGRLVAPYGVRFIVVLRSLAPVIPGLQQPQSYGSEQSLTSALRSQEDLRELAGELGYTVFADPVSAHPIPRARKTHGSSALHLLELWGEGAAWLAVIAGLVALKRARRRSLPSRPTGEIA